MKTNKTPPVFTFIENRKRQVIEVRRNGKHLGDIKTFQDPGSFTARLDYQYFSGGSS